MEKNFTTNPQVAIMKLDSLEDKVEELESDSLLMAIRMRKAVFYGIQRQMSKADSCFFKALSIHYEGDEARRASCYGAKASLFADFTNEQDSALYYLNKSDSLLENSSSSRAINARLSNCMVRIIVNRKLDKPGIMYSNCQQGMKYAEELKDTTRILVILHLNAALSLEQKDYMASEQYIRRALKYIENNKDHEFYPFFKDALGQLFFVKKEYDKASEILKETEKRFRDLKNNLQLLSENYHSQGRIAFIRKSFEKAEQYYLDALNVADSIKAYESSANICSSIIELFVAEHKYVEAQPYVFRVQELLNTVPIVYSNKENIYRILSAFNKAIGNNDYALACQDSMVIARDSVYSRERYIMRSILDVQYETEKKDKEIAMKKAEVSHLQQRFVLSSSIGFLLVMTVILIYVYMRNKMRTQKQLMAHSQELVEMTRKMLERETTDAALSVAEIEESTETEKTEEGKTLIMSAGRMNEILAKLQTAIKEEKLYRQPSVSLDCIAIHIGTNRSYLSAIINNRIGKSFSEYINFYRIEEAKQLLLSTEEKVVAIGQEVGFKSTQSFYTAFKNQTGVPPSVYRRMGK